MSQTDRLLTYLKEHPKGITPLDALQWIGTFRLAARIYDLRERGHEIRVDRVPLNGGGYVARYRLEHWYRRAQKSPR